MKEVLRYTSGRSKQGRSNYGIPQYNFVCDCTALLIIEDGWNHKHCNIKEISLFESIKCVIHQESYFALHLILKNIFHILIGDIDCLFLLIVFSHLIEIRHAERCSFP